VVAATFGAAPHGAAVNYAEAGSEVQEEEAGDLPGSGRGEAGSSLAHVDPAGYS